MKNLSNLFKGINISTVIATLVGICSLYIAFLNLTKWSPELFPKTAHFFCELRANSNEGEVWTVMYRKDKETIPWLKIQATLGGNWTPAERCQEIAQRLEIYRQDGLTKLTHRSDPNTPKQSVICAKTKISGDNCELLVTLKPNISPYSSLRDMLAEVFNAQTNTASESGGISMSASSESLVVDLEKYLSDEDRKAGDTTQ
jgi:hypothetical protein